jgi:hypothetical protein
MNREVTTIEIGELAALRSQGRAWEAVFMALKKGNDDCFHAPGSGKECALREIERLQKAAAHVPGLVRGSGWEQGDRGQSC